MGNGGEMEDRGQMEERWRRDGGEMEEEGRKFACCTSLAITSNTPHCYFCCPSAYTLTADYKVKNSWGANW
jgi:hypothetical protein